MPQFSGHGIELHYRWSQLPEQQDKPVVLLHGLGSSGQDWLPQVQVLAPIRPVLTVDLPGHGGSPPLGQPRTIKAIAEVVAELMAADTDQKYDLVGLSLGALIGLQIALDDPGRLRSMMLVNGFARYRPGQLAGFGALIRLLLLLLGRMDWLGRWVARLVFAQPGQDQLRQLAAARIASVERRTYWYYLLAVARYNLQPRLAAVEQPVLVVAGASDRIVGMAAKRNLSRGLPNGQLEIFPRSGHGTPIDSWDRFNERMIQWLQEVSGL